MIGVVRAVPLGIDVNHLIYPLPHVEVVQVTSCNLGWSDQVLFEAKGFEVGCCLVVSFHHRAEVEVSCYGCRLIHVDQHGEEVIHVTSVSIFTSVEVYRVHFF
jgi:hypothetical protein